MLWSNIYYDSINNGEYDSPVHGISHFYFTTRTAGTLNYFFRIAGPQELDMAPWTDPIYPCWKPFAYQNNTYHHWMDPDRGEL